MVPMSWKHCETENMAKVLIPSDALADPTAEPMVIDLKQPWLAAILAWMIPGLGHLYQGRTGKGLLFFICIMGTFVYGLYIGGGKVVYAAVPWEQQFRWQYFCQLGVGLPATPMLVQRARVREGKQPLWNGFMAPPSPSPVEWKDYSGNMATEPNELAKWTVALHPYFEIGTVYTVIAGLLNVLVICDAAAGPLILKPQEKKLEPQPVGSKSD
jgi:TM2 domain-containing membrane protein YozV